MASFYAAFQSNLAAVQQSASSIAGAAAAAASSSSSSSASPTLSTNYENACNVITMLQLLRHRPRPARKSSNLGSTSNTSASVAGASSSSVFQFGNIQLQREQGTDLLPFPPVHRRPFALCLQVTMDGNGAVSSGMSSSRRHNSGLHSGGNAPPTASAGMNNNNSSFCSNSVVVPTPLDVAGGGGYGYGGSGGPSHLTSIMDSDHVYPSSHTHSNGCGVGGGGGDPFSSGGGGGMDMSRVLETWTVEAYAKATVGSVGGRGISGGRSGQSYSVPAVASKAQLAGLCRQLCAHSSANPLPANVYRVGQLKTFHKKEDIPANIILLSSTESSASAMYGGGNASFDSAMMMGSTNGCGGGGNSANSTERVWHVYTSDRVPCLTVTWRSHSSGGGGGNSPTPTQQHLQLLSRRSSSLQQERGGGGGATRHGAEVANGSFDRPPRGFGGASSEPIALHTGNDLRSPLSTVGGGRSPAALSSPPNAVLSVGSAVGSLSGGGGLVHPTASTGGRSAWSPPLAPTAPAAHNQSPSTNTTATTPIPTLTSTNTAAALSGVQPYPSSSPSVSTAASLFKLIEGCERLTSSTVPQTASKPVAMRVRVSGHHHRRERGGEGIGRTRHSGKAGHYHGENQPVAPATDRKGATVAVAVEEVSASSSADGNEQVSDSSSSSSSSAHDAYVYRYYRNSHGNHLRDVVAEHKEAMQRVKRMSDRVERMARRQKRRE